MDDQTSDSTALPEQPMYYHSIDLPDGFHAGMWDCRSVVESYLGHVTFEGKSVLEVGPANGFFTFAMEQRGAAVTCLDLGERGSWDLVPGPLLDLPELEKAVRSVLRRIEKAFWHGHGLTESRARICYGSIYQAPDVAPAAEIGVLGNVLQHLRDPVGGLAALADRVTDTLIVTEALWSDDERVFTEHFMRFMPRSDAPTITQSWWLMSVPLIAELLKMLGFEIVSVEQHSPIFQVEAPERPVPHTTVVGRRNRSHHPRL